MCVSAYLELVKAVVAAASGEARGRAPLGPPSPLGGRGARGAEKFSPQQIEKSGQQRLTSGETKA